MSQFGKIFFVGSGGGVLTTGGGGAFSCAADGSDVWQPAADLLEVEGGFLVQMDLPGVDADSVEAVVEGKNLLVRGVRRAICPTASKRYIHMEISRGEFGKIIRLPEPVAETNCRAMLKNGVLEIFLPFGGRHALAVTTLRIHL